MARHRANSDLPDFWTLDATGGGPARHAAPTSGGMARRVALSAVAVAGASLVALPAQASAETATHTAAVTPAAVAHIAVQPNSSARTRSAQLALAQLGKPYVWGATGPNSFDCSGLVQYVFKKSGVNLPRTARAQSVVGAPVSKNALQVGDLVFFYGGPSHVGIYVGNGMVVHAPQPGERVKLSKVSAMPFHNARRVG